MLGPHVYSTRDLMSDYKGDEQCAGGGGDFSCFPTIAQASKPSGRLSNCIATLAIP